MGIGMHAAGLLIAAKGRGVSFGDVLTLGRQKLGVSHGTIERLLRDLESSVVMRPDIPSNDPRWRHADLFFDLLGARRVDAMDASHFEGANVIHDLNRPVPEELRGRYDVVFDGGTLEHVFNFPTAVKSCMQMAREGGRVIILSPGNNWFGHGFYQFSPELFFRVFTEENGFAVEKMTVFEDFPPGRCYGMVDPALVGRRAETHTPLSVQIMVEAIKKREVPNLLETPPLQSDYVVQWESKLQSVNRTGIRSGKNAVHGIHGWKKDLLHWWYVKREVRKYRRRSFEMQAEFYISTGYR